MSEYQNKKIVREDKILSHVCKVLQTVITFSRIYWRICSKEIKELPRNGNLGNPGNKPQFERGEENPQADDEGRL